MATYEQYGSGDYGVRIHQDDFHGQYRFPTLDEARAFQRKNGGRVFRSRRSMGDLSQVTAIAERADQRPR